MLTYLLNHKLITTQQFGFLSKCSTCTQLLDCLNDWTLSIRNRHDTDIITARCTLVQSAVLRSHVVCLSVCLSVCL